ncbi:TraB/GumN family protein [Salipiger pallidus]|uniref:TraB/GumN family protein n=1 Tax=Salipiger pallidus TaxID=1775170 RepID=A0A8J3EHQ5_9RHOB|nr:TraB/GumN family protein [Salipiger pallidus]GGG80743.1 TraB/GumN family protein [Salipiger pallidus]
MFRQTLGALLVLVPLAGAAAAQCSGQDLRQTLTAAERTQLEAMTDGMPYATGNRWRATKDGEVIDIVGTMHLSDPRLDGPAARLRPLVEEAGAVLLEMSPEGRDQLMKAMGSQPELILLDGDTLPELMTEDDWQALAAAVSERGLPAPMAAKMRPWYLSMILSMPPCMQAAMAEQNGLDSRIEAMASEADVPVLALEPWDTTFDIFNAEPLEDQVEILIAALAQMKDGGEDGLATTIAAYFDEEPGEMWQFASILMQRSGQYEQEEAQRLMDETNEALLTARNRAWIPVMLEAAEATEGPLLAGFGAAHLPGQDGVLHLLEQEGWTLTREEF